MSDDILAKLAQLNAAYRAQLPTLMQKISDLVQHRLQQPDPQLVNELIMQLHTMQGSSGTHGLTAVSEAAGSFLSQIRLWGDRELTAQERQQCQLLWRQLQQAPLPSLQPTTSVVEVTAPSPTFSSPLLLVEDSRALGMIMETNLREFGFDVCWVLTLKDAFAQVQKSVPQLAIIDLNLPDGEPAHTLKLVEHLHQQGGKSIVMTGTDDFNIRLAAVRHGADAFFSKPTKVNELVQKIRSLLDIENERPYRVLMIDDQPSVLQYYQTLLQGQQFEFRGLTSPQQLLRVLETFTPDVFILDYHMPTVSGAELAKLLRQIAQYEGIPILFMTAEQRSDIKDHLVDVGSDDVISKTISPDSLIKQLNSRVRRGRQLRRLMKQDSLTQLHNHGYIQELSQHLFAMALRTKTPLSVLMVDLDHFKQVNDRYGHAAGDRVIVALSQLLQQRLRKSDAIGRYGGEEFLVLMPETEPEAALHVMQQLLHQFRLLTFTEDRTSFSVTFSAGIACSRDFNNAQQLLEAADKTLYQAKANGRNNVLLSETLAE